MVRKHLKLVVHKKLFLINYCSVSCILIIFRSGYVNRVSHLSFETIVEGSTAEFLVIFSTTHYRICNLWIEGQPACSDHISNRQSMRPYILTNGEGIKKKGTKQNVVVDRREI